MRLFSNIQKITTKQERCKVSVPVSKSIIITNKTSAAVILYADSFSQIGYPLETKETLEIENLPEESDFFVFIQAETLAENEALYLISQVETVQPEQKAATNAVIINNN